jgi:hypothetical protein
MSHANRAHGRVGHAFQGQLPHAQVHPKAPTLEGYV